jgi:hypothetical protein
MAALMLQTFLTFFISTTFVVGSTGAGEMKAADCVDTPGVRTNDETSLLQTDRILKFRGDNSADVDPKPPEFVSDYQTEKEKEDEYKKICADVTLSTAEAKKKVEFAEKVIADREHDADNLQLKMWHEEGTLVSHHVGNFPVKQGPDFAKIQTTGSARKVMLDTINRAKALLEKAELEHIKAHNCEAHGYVKGQKVKNEIPRW